MSKTQITEGSDRKLRLDTNFGGAKFVCKEPRALWGAKSPREPIAGEGGVFIICGIMRYARGLRDLSKWIAEAELSD